MEVLLSQMKAGDEGKIIKLSAQGPLRRRLFDMGVTSGARVIFIKKAPLGDPIEINLRGYSLSLRKTEAELITVRLEEKA